MLIEECMIFVIIAIIIAFDLAAATMLIKGLKENKFLHTAVAGNVVIVASVISFLCIVILL